MILKVLSIKTTMRTSLPITCVLVFLAGILIYNLVYHTKTESLSEQLKAYQAEIESTDRSVKTIVDETQGYACWLSKVGELHSITEDISQHRYFPNADKAWKYVTFIEDFYTDSQHDKIFFTDLMDLKSGHSAIKVSDRRGRDVKVLAYLPDEIPYRVCVSSSDSLLFYLARKESSPNSFRFRFINLRDGSRGTLHTSSKKIDSLQLNTDKKIYVKDPQQGLVSFATDIQSISVLAEAMQ